MNQFSVIVGNIGTRVGDTSATFATQIKKYVNFRYQEIWERFNWGTLDEAYTFNTSAGVNDYKLPSDFFKPIYCYDNTNNIDIKELSFQDIERLSPSNLNDVGNPLKYAIYQKLNADTPPTGVFENWLRLYPNPTSTIAILMPYQLAPTDMSADTDLPVIDCDYEVEIGATAEAWRTKRQFAKAADFDQQFEEHIKHMIWRRANNPNLVVQFRPTTYPRELLY